MPKPVALAVDANILYSALLYGGPERAVLYHQPWRFHSSDFNEDELCDVLVRKIGVAPETAHRAVRLLPVMFHPFSRWSEKYSKALDIIGKKDERDAPLLALALSIPVDGIWTSDRHFNVVREVPIFRTRDLTRFY